MIIKRPQWLPLVTLWTVWAVFHLYTSNSLEITHTGETQACRILGRRAFMATSGGTAMGASLLPVFAAADDDDEPFVRGRVVIRKDDLPNESLSDAALYITARVDKPDNVPQAILDGTRGKPPPVLIKRIPLTTSAFPLQFSLTQADVALAGDNWWSREDLVLSARLDMDGVAATRDPGDLVGRGYFHFADEQKHAVTIELQGRGITGKLLTRKSP